MISGPLSGRSALAAGPDEAAPMGGRQRVVVKRFIVANLADRWRRVPVKPAHGGGRRLTTTGVPRDNDSRSAALPDFTAISRCSVLPNSAHGSVAAASS
jgi:hypothetical protein